MRQSLLSSNRLEGVSGVFVRAALLAVPGALLLVAPQAHNPYLLEKTLVFRELGVVWSLGVLAWAWTGSQLRLSWSVGALGLLALATLGADLHAGFSARIAFWGEPARMSGFMATLSFLAYLAALEVFVKKGSWPWLLLAWALAGALAGLSACWQMAFGPQPWDGRAFGWMGSPVFLADFLVLTSLITLWLGRPLAWLVLPQLAGLWLTGTRSAMVALGAGVLLAWALKREWSRSVVLRVGGLGLAGALIWLYFLGSVGHPLGLGGLSHRVTCWSGELVFVQQHPWLGWGQDNLRVLCLPEIWDRAHNWALQALVDGGALVLVATTIFYLVALRACWRVRRASPWPLAVLASTLVCLSFEPEALTTTIPMLTALAWAGQRGEPI